ncbi:MAG: fatty acid CoA ligase family protein [Gordonia sp. (in: high G+C Gram-positive bacteria)]|uniref:fatty acid CoA ligase family protein n=1 Tax=Gordonia sp. (in: high G+C Gram-positive bacteria) TaxID=84139 RepID=UPI0039E31D74
MTGTVPLVADWLDRLDEHVVGQPTAPAMTYATIDDGALPTYDDVTFAELGAWSDALAASFAADGITAGTRVIVLVDPGPELYAILLGLFKAGAVPVVIDPGMGLRPMLRCLEAARAEAFIGVPKAQAVRVLFRRSFREVRATVTVGRRWFWGGRTLDEAGRRPVGPVPEPPSGDPDRLLLVAFTTGSTGPAKAVQLTEGNLAAMLAATRALTQAGPGETALVTLPMFGLLYLLMGTRIVLPPLIPSKVGATDPLHVVNAINRFDVSTLFASPAVLGPLVDHARTHHPQLPSVRRVFSGGAPVTTEIVAGLRGVLPDKAEVFAGYGATEAIPMASIGSRELLTRLTGRARSGEGVCLGFPVDGLDVRIAPIVDGPIRDWESLPDEGDGVGEIVVAGPQVSTAYFWPAAANLDGKIPDGDRTWHRTGDLGRIDDDGRLWFVGRKSQRVVTPTGTLHSVAIEQIFTGMDGLARTALAGVGEPGAQIPVLCLELQPGANEREVLAAVRQRARSNPMTADITEFMVHPGFPVDIRHNAKIRREELSEWAGEHLSRRSAAFVGGGSR